MPKKTKPNGFLAFTLEWKSKQGRQMSMDEATTNAGKIWNLMGPEERAQYNASAKRMQGSSKPMQKLTCTGMPVAMVQQEEENLRQKEKNMQDYIEKLIKAAAKNGTLPSKKFYFIMANYFLQRLNSHLYVPAEISLCEYSLENGVNKIYHTFFAPSEDEIYGKLYDAKHHSETTHCLPLPPNAMGPSDMSAVYKDILDFVCDKGTKKFHPIYTLNNNREIIENTLEFLSYDTPYEETKLKVYSINYLLHTLKKATCELGGKAQPSSAYITNAYLDRDFFEYQNDISCQYHEEKDKTKYCAQSCVIRWSYMFSDYTCADIGITTIPGQHIPKSTKLNAIVSAPPSSCIDTESVVSATTLTSYRTNPIPEDAEYFDDKSENSDWINVAKKPAQMSKLPTARSGLPQKPNRSYFHLDGSQVGDDISDGEDFNSVVSFGRGRGILSYASAVSGRGRGYTFPQ